MYLEWAHEVAVEDGVATEVASVAHQRTHRMLEGGAGSFLSFLEVRSLLILSFPSSGRGRGRGGYY